MSISLLRTCSVPLKFIAPELQVSTRCVLHEIYIMERYVTTTYRLQKLHVCIRDAYVSSTYPKNKIDALHV